MIAVRLEVEGIDVLRRNFKKAPTLTLKYLAQATKASINEIDKQVDEGGIMQYKTPRSKRSGHLVSRWGLKKRFENGGLRGFTGPTVNYAWNVYVGYRTDPKRKRTIYWGPNRYMDRIAAAAQKGVNKYFQTAVDKIVSQTAKI